MFKAIAALSTVVMLTSFISVAHAQSSEPTEPMGSAASLEGLQERSVARPVTNDPTVSPQRSTDVPGGSERGLQLTDKVQLVVSPERGASQVGVYPADDPSSGNKLQVFYQFNPE